MNFRKPAILHPQGASLLLLHDSHQRTEPCKQGLGQIALGIAITVPTSTPQGRARLRL